MCGKRENIHWASLSEAGTLHGLQFLLWVQRIFGRRVFSVLLYPVMLYFVLFRPVARKASRDYLATHYQKYPQVWRKPPGHREVFQHFYNFGQAILDKLLAWTVDMSEDEFAINDRKLLEDFLADDRGQLIIGSHIGNLEYCRGFVQRYKNKNINVLVYDQHAANFVEIMQRINPESRVDVYQVTALDIPTMLQLKSKIDRGEWLFIAGDRIPLSGETRTVDVVFFDRLAKLPIGPYMLAKSLQCPVKLMFSYRYGKKVNFDLIDFADRVELPRKARDAALAQYAQRFTDELEKQCVNVPYQWFNFYPYWSEPLGERNELSVTSHDN